MSRDEFAHKLHALRIVNDFQHNAARSDVIFRPLKSSILANDDARDAVQQGRSTAHVAWRQGGIEYGAAVVARLQPASTFQAIHFGVQNRTALLNAPIMPSAYDFAVNHKDRANWDSPFRQAQPSFINCSF